MNTTLCVSVLVFLFQVSPVFAAVPETLKQSGDVSLESAAGALGGTVKDVPPAPKPSKPRQSKRQYDYPLENYSVEYILRGEVEERGKDGFFLHTPDDRTFELLTPDAEQQTGLKNIAKGKKFAQVEGSARRIDDLGAIRVDVVTPVSARRAHLKEPAYAAYQRPAGLLSSSDGEITIGNVRWGMQSSSGTGNGEYVWENAVIRPDMVDKVYLIKKPFYPERLAAHSLMLFTFKEGGFISSSGREAKALVLSVEAVKPPLPTIDFILSSFNREFPIVWTFSTGEEYLRFACDDEKAKLVVHEINLDAAQRRKLLQEAVKLAGVNRLGEYYNLFTNNCTITLVVALNHVLPANQKIDLWISRDTINPEANLPNIAFTAFQEKGLLTPTLITIDKTNYRDLIRKFHDDSKK